LVQILCVTTLCAQVYHLREQLRTMGLGSCLGLQLGGKEELTAIGEQGRRVT
jgi:hypothetical protein